MAERFARGGRLLAFGASAADWSDARHVAVEFVHPVIVGKRALPALGAARRTRRRAPPRARRHRRSRSGDCAVRRTPSRFAPPTDDPFVAQELTETAYHVLWELVHVFFEHLDKPAPAHRTTQGASFPLPVPRQRRRRPRRGPRRRARVRAGQGRGGDGAARADARARTTRVIAAAADALRGARDDPGARQRRLGDGRDGRRRRPAQPAHRALDLTADARDPHRGRQRHRRRGDVRPSGHRLRPAGRRARRVHHQRRVGQRHRRARRGAPARAGDDRVRRLRRRPHRRRGPGRPRRRRPLGAHPPHPGGPGHAPGTSSASGWGDGEALADAAGATGGGDGPGRRLPARTCTGSRTSSASPGSSATTSAGVFVEVEGDAGRRSPRFVRRLPAEAPPLARRRGRDASATSPRPGERGLRDRRLRAPDGGAAAPVTPDAATCDDCLRELFDPADRRFRYPFVNCTNCGPRFTIVRDVPYDRPLTTMAGFTMCPACQAEYDDPADRRFHAQPNACPDCGPRLSMPVDEAVERLARAARSWRSRGSAATTWPAGPTTRRRSRGCARASTARTGRSRSWRRTSPPPARWPTSRTSACSSPPPARSCSPRAGNGAAVRRRSRPGSAELGVMLPYTPLHHLLVDGAAPLVMTSGNVSDEPIAFRDEDALRAAGRHRRRLRAPRPADPHAHGRLRGARRARSCGARAATCPARLRAARTARRCSRSAPSSRAPSAWPSSGRAWVGHHIGDLKNFETLTAFTDGDRALRAALRRRAGARRPRPAPGLPLDHVRARPRPAGRRRPAPPRPPGRRPRRARSSTGTAVGAIYDGAGLGTDGTVWGGEILVGDLRGFERAGHLHPVRLPGGDAAAREPWRMATAWLVGRGRCPCPTGMGDDRAAVRDRPRARRPPSAGRLFDAVAALCGVRSHCTYEGQAAIELEALADPAEPGAYGFDGPRRPARSIAQVLADRGDPGTVAARFHRGLAEATAAALRRRPARRPPSSPAASSRTASCCASRPRPASAAACAS